MCWNVFECTQAVLEASNNEARPSPFASLLGDIGLLEDLISIAKSVDLEAAKAPFASTLKAPTTSALTVTADTSCPSNVTPVASLETVFMLIGALCDGHRVNQTRFRRADGVALVHTWLRYPTGDPASKPQVVLVVHCLWNAVVGNTKSENKLVADVSVSTCL